MRRLGVAALAVFLVAVVLDNVELQGCQQPGWPSALTYDGEAYVAVWAAPQRRKSTIFVGRFRDSDFKGAAVATAGLDRRFPERVYRTGSVLAPPEIAFGGDGFMVFVHTGDRQLVAVPLDRQAVASGDPVVVAGDVDMLCVSPVAIGGRYMASYLGGGELVIAGLDRRGAVVSRERFEVSGPLRCAMGAGDGRFAVIVERSSGPRVSTALGRDLVVQVAGDGGPLRIAREPGGWAMLHQRQGRLRIIRLRDGGERGDDTAIPAQVNPSSVDLARSDRGLFVTWLDGRMFRMAFVDRFDQTGSFKTERGPLGTRALGHGDRCAATWTTDAGRKVWVLRATGC